MQDAYIFESTIEANLKVARGPNVVPAEIVKALERPPARPVDLDDVADAKHLIR